MQQIENSAMLETFKSRADVIKNDAERKRYTRNVFHLFLTSNLTFADKHKIDYSRVLAMRNESAKFCIKSLNQFERVISLAANAYERCDKISENMHAIMKTAINAAQSQTEMTRNDFRDSLDCTAKIADDKSAIIFRRLDHLDQQTVTRQTNLCFNVLQALNVIEYTSRDTFKIKNNALMKAIAKVIV